MLSLCLRPCHAPGANSRHVVFETDRFESFLRPDVIALDQRTSASGVRVPIPGRFCMHADTLRARSDRAGSGRVASEPVGSLEYPGVSGGYGCVQCLALLV